MVESGSYEEYIGPVEGFTEEDYERGRRLWDLLHQIESLKPRERRKATKYVKRLELYKLLRYFKKRGYMNEEIFAESVKWLDFSISDPENGYLLDMIIDYFADPQ